MNKMTLSQELKWRGFVNQSTLKDVSELDKKRFSIYFGVDPSSDSMTIGNLASAMMVKTFLRHKNDVTLLIGGATGLIGDPSFKDAERKMPEPDVVASNVRSIVDQYHNLFGYRIRIVNNLDWFKNFGYLDFLRDVGKHFSINTLIQRDYVSKRIGADGTGMSYAEFSYSLIQGYDFYHLNRQYGVNLQVCGSDQWGNSISGVDLVRRKTGEEVHVYSAPLIINKTSGIKFGKSENGAVWLDSKKTSVYQFFQFWLNIDDDSVAEYLKIFTELDKEHIVSIMTEFETDKSMRRAQKALALEVTTLIHGQQRASYAQKASDTLFGDAEFLKLGKKEVDMLKNELTVTKSNRNSSIVSILVETELAASNSEANRLILAGSISINGNKVTIDNQIIFARGMNLLKRGKNNFALVDYK